MANKLVKLSQTMVKWMREDNYTLEDFLNQELRGILNFDYETDEPNVDYGEDNPITIKVGDKYYSFILERGECIEATWEGKIFDWEISDIKEIEYVEPPKAKVEINYDKNN